MEPAHSRRQTTMNRLYSNSTTLPNGCQHLKNSKLPLRWHRQWTSLVDAPEGVKEIKPIQDQHSEILQESEAEIGVVCWSYILETSKMDKDYVISALKTALRKRLASFFGKGDEPTTMGHTWYNIYLLLVIRGDVWEGYGSYQKWKTDFSPNPTLTLVIGFLTFRTIRRALRDHWLRESKWKSC